MLQTSVADFGAKIMSLSSDIDRLKDQYNQINHDQKISEENYNKLEAALSTSINNTLSSTNSNVTAGTIEILKTSFSEQFSKLASNLSTINDTLSQRTKSLEDDFTGHKQKLDILAENFANTTSHVTSMENDWTLYKQKFIGFEEISKNITADLIDVKNNSDRIVNAVNAVQSECRSYQKQNDRLFTEIDILKKKSMVESRLEMIEVGFFYKNWSGHF